MADQNLAAMILEEIPTQMVNCFKKCGVKLETN